MQAFRLHQQLSEALQRRDEWREKDKETPQEERERLLQQVKADNQEIGSFEKMLELLMHVTWYNQLNFYSHYLLM